MAPLRQIALAVARRSPENLKPMTEPAPAETRVLVDSLNKLFLRLEKTLEREKQFTADAAHELRTPLSGLKTQAQVALGARDAAERDHALRQLNEGVDRAAHLVQQLLTLARLEPSAATQESTPVNLADLAKQVCGELAPAAVAKMIDLSFLGEVSVLINGNQELLRVLFRNLIDNAIRYTPERGVIEVVVGQRAAGAEVTVTDSGPGIPQEERERVFDRFYRILGNKASGSGLGLSIVRRIVELHGGDIVLGEGRQGKGLRVVVRFS